MSADSDDEHRAHLAHEHPVDVDSSPSSMSSGTHPYFHARRGSKTGSSSSHLLARLISGEEQVRELKATLAVTSERLEAESSRANAAERRALDYFHRLRIATENRERAEQESARLREELKLYKLQLENAQKEIFRAQDIIDQVASQRNEAEAEAAKARTKARKLQEEKLVMLAREEGRRLGYREGLSIGRRIGYDEEMNDDDENVPELGEATTDEERDDPRSHTHLRSSASIRQQPMRSESAPPVRTFETPLHAPPLPVRVHTPSHEHHPPSPPRERDEPETIRPIPIRASPIISTRPISVPIDDGWIPRADSRTSHIHMPSPHQLQQPIPASPRSNAPEPYDGRSTPQPEPTPVPPPVRSRDYAYQRTAPPSSIPRGHTPSLASRASTHLSQYDLVNKRPGSSLRNEIYVGRARSGSQPSRESMSRNEHRDQERRHISRTEAENIADQWRADSDTASTPRNPPRSLTPSAVPHPHRPPNFYRTRETVAPMPLGDADDPRSRTPVPTESTAPRPQLPDDPGSRPAHLRPLIEYHRQRVRQRPGSGGSGSIPNIIVESPSEPETTMSPSATTAAQPELLSPEAANRPLPQDDVGQHQHQHQHQHHPSHAHAHSQSQSQSRHHNHAPPSYDAVPRSGAPYTPSWPAGFIPYPPGYGTTSSSRSGPERDHRRTSSRPSPSPAPTSHSHSARNGAPKLNSDLGRSQNGYVRARTQSASTPMGRAGSGSGAYEAAPLPLGMTYPVPPVRPHTSHRRHRDRDREREWELDRDRDRDRLGDRDRERDRDRDRDRERLGPTGRDARDWDWEQDRERVRDRDRDRDGERERRYDAGRDYERERDRDGEGDGEGEQDPEDMGLDEELPRSPAPLQRPISLFDSDEA